MTRDAARCRAGCWLGLLIVLLVCARAAPADAAALDFPLPDGHFFTEANGNGGADGTGFAVTNASGITFWSQFRAGGGVATYGNPVSGRFSLDGFPVQIFQKAVFQWNNGSVAYLNILDRLHDAGGDPWLQAFRQTPPPDSTAPDHGLTFERIVARHRTLLAADPAIEAAYDRAANSLALYGLPLTHPMVMGNAVVVRCQRAVFQHWLVDVPWARAGQVTVANGGDLFKQAQSVLANLNIPAPALRPVLPPAPFTYVAMGESDAAGVGASSPAKSYPALLAERLASRYSRLQYVNLAVSGATTSDILTDQAARLPALRPDLVTLTVGVNDGIQGVDAVTFSQQLDQLLTRIDATHPSVVAVGNLPDVALAPAVPPFLKPFVQEEVLAYNAELASVVSAHHDVLVDLYGPSVALVPAPPDLVSGDGFHPSDVGYQRYAQAFWSGIEPRLR